MKQCVGRDGTINFVAWQSLGEDVTTEEFLQLEEVALFEADLQWEQTDFHREWVKSGGASAPIETHPIAVQSSTPPRPDDTGFTPPSESDLRTIIRNARLLARKAHADGMGPDDDPLQWLAKPEYT